MTQMTLMDVETMKFKVYTISSGDSSLLMCIYIYIYIYIYEYMLIKTEYTVIIIYILFFCF